MVTGSRGFGCFKDKQTGELVVVKRERDYIYDVLTAVTGYDPSGTPLFCTLIHGACPTGTDRVADSWAKKYMLGCIPFPAEWDVYGKHAGPDRNQKMVNSKPDMVVAFPGGNGTRDACERAFKVGIPVFEARYDEPDCPCCSDGPLPRNKKATPWK